MYSALCTVEVAPKETFKVLLMDIEAPNEQVARDQATEILRKLNPNCLYGCGQESCEAGGFDINDIFVTRF